MSVYGHSKFFSKNGYITNFYDRLVVICLFIICLKCNLCEHAMSVHHPRNLVYFTMGIIISSIFIFILLLFLLNHIMTVFYKFSDNLFALNQFSNMFKS